MKNLKTILGMTMLAFMAASCSNDIDEVLTAPSGDQVKTIHLTIGVSSKGNDATTRAISATDSGIKSQWEKGEKIYLYCGEKTNAVEGEITEVREDGSAIFEAELPGEVSTGDPVTLRYPTALPHTLATQTGDLEPWMDFREATSTIKVSDDGETATVTGGIEMKAKFVIAHFNIPAWRKLIVYSPETGEKYAGSFTFTIERESGFAHEAYIAFDDKYTGDIYFIKNPSHANPAIELSKGDAGFAKATKKGFKAGKFFDLKSLNWGEFGDVIGSDGNFYKTIAECTKADPIAILVTIGLTHGENVAISLNQAQTSYSGALNGISKIDSKPFNGFWNVPSIEDFRQMLWDCGGGEVSLKDEQGYGSFPTLVNNKVAGTSFPLINFKDGQYWVYDSKRGSMFYNFANKKYEVEDEKQIGDFRAFYKF